MKNAKNILVGAMVAMTIATYANANTSAHILTVEEKQNTTYCGACSGKPGTTKGKSNI
jgi:hypothetical protein